VIERIKSVSEWIAAHRGTESGEALAKFAMTDRLYDAQAAACDEIEDCGFLSAQVADELKLAAYMEETKGMGDECQINTYL